MRTFRLMTSLVLPVAVLSCTNSGSSEQEAARRAAYAATAHLSAERPPSDLHVAVLVKGNQVRLVNFTDDTIRDADIWINGTFVYHLDALPARGSVTVLKNSFYDKTGHSFAETSIAARSVTLQRGDTVNTTLGPVNE